MIINYKILWGYTINELETAVRIEIAKGWEPHGSLSVYGGGGNIARSTFMQPMIKRLVKKEKITLD